MEGSAQRLDAALAFLLQAEERWRWQGPKTPLPAPTALRGEETEAKRH